MKQRQRLDVEGVHSWVRSGPVNGGNEADNDEDLHQGAPRRGSWELLLTGVGIAAVLAAWEGAVRGGMVSGLVLPAPSAIAAELGFVVRDIVTGGPMLRHTAVTLVEVLAGFGIAVAGGLSLGVLIAELRPVRRMLMPYLISLNAAPKIALAPLLVVWFGFGIASKIIMAALIAFFPVLVNVVSGLASVDEGKLRLMRSLAASRWTTFTRVKLFDALPHIFAGAKTAIVLAVVGAVVGEFVSADIGLGHLIKKTEYQLDVALTFAAIVLLAGIGILLFYAIEALERKLVFWTRTES